MIIDEAYKCPCCGGNEVSIDNIQILFEDARFEDVECINCHSSWRIYYKMNELKTELRYTTSETSVSGDVTSNQSESVLEIPIDNPENSFS